MELDNKLIEKSMTHHHHQEAMFLSDHSYSNKPSVNKDGFFFEEATAPASSSKVTNNNNNFLQDFLTFDQFNANGSSLNPMFGVQTGSNFDPFDVFPYGSSTNMENFYDDYECKPVVTDHRNNGTTTLAGQIMDNFQSGGGYNLNLSQRNNNTNNPIDNNMVGLNNNNNNNPIQAHHFPLSFQEILMKPISFVVPDEVSCVTANNHQRRKKVGVNKNNRVLSSARRMWKGRKKNNVVKGQWTIDEDRLLTQLVEQYGIRKWSHIAQMLPGRIGKQCRERWHNHLRPDIKKDVWSEEEDKVLIEAHAEIGNKWAEIAKRLPGRTENSIKNHWNATKRRQYSKRKCRSKYPRGSLLQEYIKSLNLDSVSCPAGRTYTSQGKGSSATDHQDTDNKLAQNNMQQQNAQGGLMEYMENENRLVSLSDYNNGLMMMSEEVAAEFDFDEKLVMFQERYSFDSLLDGMTCHHRHHHHHLVEEKSFDVAEDEEDVNPLMMMDFEVNKELDLVEMISQAKM